MQFFVISLRSLSHRNHRGTPTVLPSKMDLFLKLKRGRHQRSSDGPHRQLQMMMVAYGGTQQSVP